MTARYSRATAVWSRAALVDELLEGLLGVGHRGEFSQQADPARQRFDRLAFALLEEAAQVGLRPAGLAGAIKMGAETVGVRRQALEHGGREAGA
jgi:hypothetical protein